MKNLKFTVLFSLLALITCVSCERFDQNNTFEILVKDGNSWSLSNKEMTPVAGAVVNLYKSQEDIIAGNPPAYTGTTDDTGVAKLTVKVQEQLYYLVAEKEGARNVHNGLVIYKMFESQDEVNASALQTPAAAIGTPMFHDINADGLINSSDAEYGLPLGSNRTDETKITVIIYKY